LRSFDAFTSEPVDTDIYISSQDEVLQTNEGVAVLRTNVESNVSDFAVRTADQKYLSAHFVQNGRKEFIHIPMIQDEWLEQIKKIKLVNSLPGTGTVIAFTPQLKWEAFLASENYDKSNIIYFTKDGELSDVPQANGGFIMFNVAVGAKEIVLHNLENEKISSQVVSVEDQQLAVMTFAD
jgi:hypothetical protein